MSVVDFSKKKSVLGKGMDLIKLTIDSALINAEKSLFLASNTFDAALAAQGKLAAELTGKTVSLADVTNPDVNIWCSDGQFVPSELQEEKQDSSSSEDNKPLTKADALALIEAMQKKNQENLLILLKEMAKEEDK